MLRWNLRRPKFDPMRHSTILLLTGGRSKRMGSDKASLEIGGVPQGMRMARIASTLAGRVVEVGGSIAGVERIADRGEGPHNAVVLALGELALPRSEIVVVLPVDLFAMDNHGLSWLMREVHRSPGVLEGRDGPNYAVFGAPVGYLERRSNPMSLRDLVGGLRHIVPPAGLVDRFFDADTRSEFDRVQGRL